MIPTIDPLIPLGAVALGELAEDLGAGARAKLVCQVLSGILLALMLYLAPTFPWVSQVLELGLFGGLVAAGLIHASATLGPQILPKRAAGETPASHPPSTTPASVPTPAFRAADPPVAGFVAAAGAPPAAAPPP